MLRAIPRELIAGSNHLSKGESWSSPLGSLGGEVSRVADGLAGVPDELRELAGGIHPTILAEGDLGPALRTLARGSSIPVKLEVIPEGRLPDPVRSRPTMSHQNR